MARNGRKLSTKRENAAPIFEDSKRAAAALAKELAVPGVALVFDKDTPIFTADPSNPELVLREWAGKTVRGRFENGVFIELP